MCLSEPHIQLPPPPVRDSEDCKTFTSTLHTMACRPSWTLRGLFKPQASRPGLPRRFHTKINLNEYWGALEKVVKVEVSFPTQQATPHPSPATMDLDNEVNDNLANERTEQKMEVDQEDDQEEDKEGIAEEQVVEVIVAKVTTPPKLQVRPPTEPSPTGRQKKRRSSRRPSGSPGAAPACSPACGPPAPPPCRRTPLGTINGMAGREHLRKNLSPLAVFAENLARRLNRQY